MILKSIVKIGQNSALVIGSVLFSLAVTEIALRFTNLGRYSLYDRILFFTEPSLVQAPDHTVRYEPQQKIRSVAIYGDQVDYDTTYHANNLGFIDEIDYDPTAPATKTVAFIGDSFTVGDGGNQSWFSQLRAEAGQPALALYNFGVTGTGILHFQQLLASLKNSITFDEINIMVIGNDFFRPFWIPVVREEGMWFCPPEQKKECLENNPPIIQIADQDDSQEDLLARAKKLYALDNQGKNPSVNGLQRSRLYTLICDAYRLRNHTESLQTLCPHLKVSQANEYDKNDLYQKSLASLQEIKNSFPGVTIRVVHIPEKGETFNKQYSLDPKDDIEPMGLQYISLLDICPWDSAMYHKHDPHFNEAGYANLADCVSQNVLKSDTGVHNRGNVNQN